VSTTARNTVTERSTTLGPQLVMATQTPARAGTATVMRKDETPNTIQVRIPHAPGARSPSTHAGRCHNTHLFCAADRAARK